MGIFRYALIGGVCTVADLSLFLFLTKWLQLHYLAAGTVSFSLAVVLNYYLCINFLFTSGIRFTKSIELVSFFAISLTGLLIHHLFLYLSVERFDFDLLISKVIATAGVFFWNYLSRKLFVFKTT
ncbi:MAG: GtrA family protein [Desulfuromonadales bacterium]|nr:GtrA family protein [Desulfuromonadales bacterium]